MLNHIQYLRAISVIFVFLFHFQIDYFKNGYLGVDIFFVISGFVITYKLHENFVKKKRIDILEFYSKRLKRIIPALFFFLVISYLLIIVLLPSNFSLGTYFYHTVSSLLGFSNLIFLYLKYDYFDDAELSPLLHTWSLGVEEQFYLVYPILLSLILLLEHKKKIVIVLILFFLVSLSLNFLDFNKGLKFYFPFFRFWEFLIGCICFFLKDNNLLKNSYLNFFSLSIIFLFLISNIDLNFLNYLIIVFCSGVFIISYKNYFIESLINNQITIFFGKISFSFYLWHFLIIYFFNYYFSLNTILLILITFILTTLISTLSFNYIEERFRYKIFKFKDYLGYLSILTLLLLIILKTSSFENFWNSNGKKRILMKSDLNYLNSKHNVHNRFFFFNKKINNNHVYKFCNENHVSTENLYLNILIEKCLKKSLLSEKIFYLEGDSRVIQYLDLFTLKDFKHDVYLKQSPNNNISSNELNKLKNFYNEVWYVRSINSISELNKFKKQIEQLDNKVKIFVFGPMPFFQNLTTISCLIKEITCTFETDNDLTKREINFIYEELNTISNKNVKVMNVYNLICPDKKCNIYRSEQDKLIFRDGGHLSAEGVIFLLKKPFLKLIKN